MNERLKSKWKNENKNMNNFCRFYNKTKNRTNYYFVKSNILTKEIKKEMRILK